MITSTRRVSADKPEVQIAFSLDKTSGNASADYYFRHLHACDKDNAIERLTLHSPHDAWLLPKWQQAKPTRSLSCGINSTFAILSKETGAPSILVDLWHLKNKIHLATKSTALSKCFTAIRENALMAAAAWALQHQVSVLIPHCCMIHSFAFRTLA